MGKIKKLLESDLVGGVQKTDIYPVTSIKAVYDESNERLDNILARRGVINISTNYNTDHTAEVLTLAEAIEKVPTKDRVLGFTGKFLSPSGWVTYDFIGSSLTEWSDSSMWKSETGTNFSGNWFTNNGVYINDTGGIASTSNPNAITDYISLDNVDSITIVGRSTSLVSLYAFYNESKLFISGCKGTEYDSIKVTINKADFPAGAKYFIGNGHGSSTDYLYIKSIKNLHDDIEEVKTNTQEQVNSINGNWFIQKGVYIHSDGNIISTENPNAVTEYIDITNVEKITIRGRSTTAFVKLYAFYDSSKKYISGLQGGEYSDKLITITKDEFPGNAKYFVGNGYNDPSKDFLSIVTIASLYTQVNKLTKSSSLLGDVVGVAGMGASLMYNGNNWFEDGCALVGVTPYNKAVSGDGLPKYFAEQLYHGTFCTDEEFENMDILAIQFASSGDVYHGVRSPLSTMESAIKNGVKASDTEYLHYILLKWQQLCYSQKDNPNSRWYNTKHGKPCRILLITHWHDGRLDYNNSIRNVAEKLWGMGLCEFDKEIGFSKNQTLNGTQISTLYAVDTEVIDNVTYGWHPLRGSEGAYIQGRMANIFANSLLKYFQLKY